MAPPPPPPRNAAGCGGDGCTARDPWPLHHVRHRSIFYRLCTSCVLKYNPSSFCSLCLSLLESPPLSPIVHCATCPMVSHLSCLPNPNIPNQFVCPSCESGGQRPVLFPKIDGKRRVIDLESSRVLLAATRLAVESMGRAAAGARAEVERKTKEAVVARKRAREMLERNVVAGLRTVTVVEELKRKKKRLKGREIEKWISSHEKTPMITRDRLKGEEKLNAKQDEKEKLLNTGQSGQEEKGQAYQEKMASSSISTSKRSTWECSCKRPTVLGKSTTTNNSGRLFWRCHNWKDTDKNCGYFAWDDEFEDGDHVHLQHQIERDDTNYMKKNVVRDEMKYAMYPLVGYLGGFVVGIFLGFLLAKL